MKTAVEWMEEMFNNSEIPNSSMLFKQAKEIEKEQITEAFKQGIKYWNGDEYKLIDIEQYYNETFKSE